MTHLFGTCATVCRETAQFLRAAQEKGTHGRTTGDRQGRREYLNEESLTALKEELAKRLVRLHRNCLVAREAIIGFERLAGPDADARWVVMPKGLPDKLALSRRQQHLVREFARKSFVPERST